MLTATGSTGFRQRFERWLVDMHLCLPACYTHTLACHYQHMLAIVIVHAVWLEGCVSGIISGFVGV
jgi:hypothetical protein